MWSWILFGVAFIVMYASWQAGNRKRWAWFLLALTNIPWALYGVLSAQYGFLATGLLYMAVYSRNWARHERD